MKTKAEPPYLELYVQRQTVVTAYFSSEQLLLFAVSQQSCAIIFLCINKL